MAMVGTDFISLAPAYRRITRLDETFVEDLSETVRDWERRTRSCCEIQGGGTSWKAAA
jgi:hypothetical protein